MKIKGFSVERTEFDIDDETYRMAKEGDYLSKKVDVYVSDMDGSTVLVLPDGTAVNLYGSPIDLLKLARPILDEIPTWVVEQYVASRRSDDE